MECPRRARARAKLETFEILETFSNIDQDRLRGVTLPTLAHWNHFQVISLLKSHPFVTQRKETNDYLNATFTPPFLFGGRIQHWRYQFIQGFELHAFIASDFNSHVYNCILNI